MRHLSSLFGSGPRSRLTAFDQRHFLLGQAVEVIEQAVNLAVGGLEAALEEVAVGGSPGLKWRW